MNDTTTAIGGFHAVHAALASQRQVHEVLLRDDRADARAQQILTAAGARGIAVRQVSAQQLEQLLPGVNHQGCAALAAPAQPLAEAVLPALLETAAKPLVLVLDQVQDPHNLGACLRSAAAAGADAVIVPRDRAAGLTPVVRKVAAGGAELVPLVRVTNLARTLQTLKQQGLWLVGAAGEAADSLYAVDCTVPLALVLGSEGSGLRRLTARHCDHLAQIPMPGGLASLNVSVAAGVCLFEALRQRAGPG